MDNLPDVPSKSLSIQSSTPMYYVAVGASAGGLEAIEAFFKHMPLDTGLAFILVQHLSPDYKSLMPELLENRTEIPVFRAENNMQVLANHIYLITPRKNLTIFHGRLLLQDQERSGGLNLPIDIFFKSLSEDQGEKAIGIILSGTGSDGTRGARAIKEVGGMVMVQSEESAKFDGMPRSVIATGLADFILTPEDMAAQLQAYSKHPYANPLKRNVLPITNEEGMTRIFALLRERSRIDFTFYKPSTIVRRIERRMMVNHIQDIPSYVRFLSEHFNEVEVLYQDLLIGVTSFMRDPLAFEVLS
ncbi:chemotaxis protein CheR, partial [Achromatium sp. WMS2]